MDGALLARALDVALKAAGIPIVSVSIGRADDRATWAVLPKECQGAAQPIIDAFDASAVVTPRPLSTRELMRRFTPEEIFGLFQLASKDKDACKLWHTLVSDGETDVASAEWNAGVQMLTGAGVVAGIWPDRAKAQKRAAEIAA